MTSRRSNRRGFTLIELILAVAITVLLVACVYSATQAMSNTARRQIELGAKQTRRDRFEEIVRRDLRGWMQPKPTDANATPATPAPPTPTQPTAPASAPTPDNPILLQFFTTADALTSALPSASASAPISRSTSMQYVVHKSSDGFEIARIELTSTNLAASEIVLYRSVDEPKVEVFDGKAWFTEWKRSDRPKAVRWTLGPDTLVIKI